MYAIETTDLSFGYRNKSLLESINLLVPSGSIYGYLGKNGAGKSTTIKLLLGLLPVSRGAIRYNGLDLNSNKMQILSMVGSLVESPAYYGNLTGYENLLYLKNIYEGPQQNIKDVLHKVNLFADKDRKVKQYSSGMKQRLGIAMALINNPSTLILDEPLNGLDPEGVFEMRELIVGLKEEGKTIFLSSHILSEMQKTCTHIGVIQQGKLCFQGTLQELLDSVPTIITVRAENVDGIRQLCREQKIEIRSIEQGCISVTMEKRGREAFVQQLYDSGARIQGIDSTESDLESVYLNLTKKNIRL